MLFFGMANAYVMRTNMSVAIVAMVNHTSITESKEPVLNECKHENNANNDSSSFSLAVSTTQNYFGLRTIAMPFSVLPSSFLISIDPS